MVAAAASRGDVLIKNVIPKHLESITSKLIEMGVDVEEFDDSVRVSCPAERRLHKISVKTLPLSGLPDGHAAADCGAFIRDRGDKHDFGDDLGQSVPVCGRAEAYGREY